jgi:putative hydrolase of the HAD superfamily
VIARALVFDVDGVIINGRPADGRRWDVELQRDLGLCPRLLADRFFRLHWRDVVIGHVDLEARLAPILAEIAPDLSFNELVDYWFANDARLDLSLLRDVAHCRADGWATVLATNQEHRRAAYIWNTIGLMHHFDAICYSAALGVCKPSPCFFNAVATSIGCEPPQLLLIDDSASNVEAALSSGWQAQVWTGEESLADVLSAWPLAGRALGC